MKVIPLLLLPFFMIELKFPFNISQICFKNLSKSALMIFTQMGLRPPTIKGFSNVHF